MSESWAQYEGQVIDGKFSLRRYLGGSNHSIVFLTNRLNNSSQDAAIKLIPASSVEPDLHLSRWEAAAQLSHPHLLRLFDKGRCTFDSRDWLYVVTEFAEENLGEILPERSLTQEEIRDALNPTLEAIQYLHSKNLIHGRIKPSNVLVVGDQIKLSADSVLESGDALALLPFPSAYDAPECASGAISHKSDLWSLALVMVEAFTQKSPAINTGSAVEPDIPDTLPKSLLDIARHTLVQDPEQRWNATEIAAQLNPQSKQAVKVATVSAAAPSKTNIPDRQEIPAKMRGEQFSKLPPIPATRNQASSKRSYFLPAAIVVAILIAVLVISNFANRKGRDSSAEPVAEANTRTVPQSDPPAQSSSKQPSVSQIQSKQPEKETVARKEQQSQVVSQDSLKNASEKSKIPVVVTSPSAVVPKNPTAKGDVLEQVLPDVSEKARGSIRGTVRVSVRVHVSPAGTVTQSALDSESSSKYFSDLALQAARRWTFQSPEVDGHSAPSEWLIRFEFTPADTKAFPRQATP